MNWTNKLNDFRVECIKALQEALKKGYDKRETEIQDTYQLPIAIYYGDTEGEFYSLIYWDKEENSFLGIHWYDSSEFWFEIDDLETRTICHLIDLINEQDKV